MEGVENSPNLEPTEIHRQLWRDATPLLGRLKQNPRDKEADSKLKEINVKIKEENAAHKYSDAMLNSHTVAIDHFRATFLEAAPLEARLRVDPADGEARARFDALTGGLRALNRLHQHPA